MDGRKLSFLLSFLPFFTHLFEANDPSAITRRKNLTLSRLSFPRNPLTLRWTVPDRLLRLVPASSYPTLPPSLPSDIIHRLNFPGKISLRKSRRAEIGEW